MERAEGLGGLGRVCCSGVVFFLFFAIRPAAAVERGHEKISNEKVIVSEVRLEPGQELVVRGDRASAIVHLEAGTLEFRPQKGPAIRMFTERGHTSFEPAAAGVLRNAGRKVVAFVRIEFVGVGSHEKWATKGLAAQDKLLFENAYARAYTIRLAAGSSEPEQRLKRRVVVCLSGAKLAYRLPDGQQVMSSSRPGDVSWREPASRTPHNVGRTEFWAVAIEPK